MAALVPSLNSRNSPRSPLPNSFSPQIELLKIGKSCVTKRPGVSGLAELAYSISLICLLSPDEQRAAIKGVWDEAPATAGLKGRWRLSLAWVSAQGGGGGGRAGGSRRTAAWAMSATCRTVPADAARWGNRWQRAAGPIRGRSGGGGRGDGPPPGPPTAVNPSPPLPPARVLEPYCACKCLALCRR